MRTSSRAAPEPGESLAWNRPPLKDDDDVLFPTPPFKCSRRNESVGNLTAQTRSCCFPTYRKRPAEIHWLLLGKISKKAAVILPVTMSEGAGTLL